MKLKDDEKALLSRAEDILEMKCPSITDFRAPQSEGGIHDYFSQGTYWHPDPTKPDGKPYIQRDGIINKNNFVKHKDMIVDVKRALTILYWAYQDNGDSRYISKMDDILYTFFVDPEKYVTPALNYSQAIPGKCAGRGIGLIDFNQLVTVPLIVRWMKKNNLGSADVIKGVENWCSAYSKWLETSEFGHTESHEKNNHSIAFYLQYSAFSIFREDWNEVRAEISKVFKERLLNQLDEDGSFPLELKRTRPYWYSIFTVENMVLLAQVITTDDDNIYEYEREDGRSLKKAIYFIAPYMLDKSSWPMKPDVEKWEYAPLADAFLVLAGKAYGDDALIDLYMRLPEVVDMDVELERNVPVFIPELI